MQTLIYSVWEGGVSGTSQESQAQPCSPPLCKCRIRLMFSPSTEAPTLCAGKTQCLRLLTKSLIHWCLKMRCGEMGSVSTGHTDAWCDPGAAKWPAIPSQMVSFFGGKALIKCKGVILARLALRFRTWIVAYRWTFGLHSVFKCLNFPQDRHNPFHSCGCCLGCGGTGRGSPSGAAWAPGHWENFQRAGHQGIFSLGLSAAACAPECEE